MVYNGIPLYTIINPERRLRLEETILFKYLRREELQGNCAASINCI